MFYLTEKKKKKSTKNKKIKERKNDPDVNERIKKFNKNAEKLITISSDEHEETNQENHQINMTNTNDTIQIPRRIRRRNLVDSYTEATQRIPTTNTSTLNHVNNDDDDILLLDDKQLMPVKTNEKSDDVIIIDEKLNETPDFTTKKPNKIHLNNIVEVNSDEELEKWLVNETFSEIKNESKSAAALSANTSTAFQHSNTNTKAPPIAVVKPFNASVEQAESSKYFANESSLNLNLNQTSNEVRKY